jgi:hypothetical protein
MENSTPIRKTGIRNKSSYSRNIIKTAKIEGRELINYKNKIIPVKKIVEKPCNYLMKCNLSEIDKKFVLGHFNKIPSQN